MKKKHERLNHRDLSGGGIEVLRNWEILTFLGNLFLFNSLIPKFLNLCCFHIGILDFLADVSSMIKLSYVKMSSHAI
jgi:hypothetical protein